MAFFNKRIFPEPLCPSTTGGETELSNSLPLDEIITDNFIHDENKETPTIDYGGVKENQDGLDGIPEEEVHNKPSGEKKNGELSARSHSSNLNSWSNHEGVNSSGRHRGCDRVILWAVCFVSAASLLLTLLMLFGIVEPLNCACSGETVGRVAWTDLSENVQTLKDNVSSLEEISVILSTDGKSLQESIKEISENLTKLREEINRTQLHLLKNKQAITTLNSTSLKEDVFLDLWHKLNSTENDLRDVKDQVINMSKIVPPRGPPGYNGTQGPVGSPGPSGPRGSPGPGANFSLCKYKKKENRAALPDESTYANAEISVTELKGKQIMAVHCDTNDAKVTELSRSFDGSHRQKYTCKCKGLMNAGAYPMYCYIHYWECPLST